MANADMKPLYGVIAVGGGFCTLKSPMKVFADTCVGDREQGLEHSLCWKMRRAYQLTGNLCFVWDGRGYVGAVRDTRALFGESASADLWAWSEGSMHKYYEDRATGRCSLQAFIDFDIGGFEAEADRVINLCIGLHERIGLAIPEEPIEESGV
jgi:hypothetical protein